MTNDSNLTRVRVLVEAGQYAEAVAFCVRSWDGRGNGIAQALLDAAEAWGDEGAAVRLLQTFAAAGEVHGYEALADLLTLLERWEEAAAALKAAIAQGRPVQLWLAAVLAEELGERPGAEHYYQRALALGDPHAPNDYGLFLSEDEDRADEAILYLRRAVDSGDVLASRNLGCILLEADRPAEAVPLLRRALASGRRTALAPLGHALLLTGEYPEAEEHLRAALDEEQEGARFAYALLLANTGRFQEATTHYEAAALEDGEVNAHLNLALLYDDLDEEDDRAERWYLSALEHGDEAALVRYADFLERCDRHAEIPGLPARSPDIELTAGQQAELTALADTSRIGRHAG